MNYFVVNKNICMRIRVSCENQELMRKYADRSYTPLFELKGEQILALKFEYNSFTCTYNTKKQEFVYKDIKKIETHTDGIIIYLNNGTYLSIATERCEKHNSELYDIVVLLKRRCHRVFAKGDKIIYPDYDSGRYVTNKEAIAQIPFTLSEKEIKRDLWYDYLIQERMSIFTVVILIALISAVITQNILIMAGALPIIIIDIILTVLWAKDIDGYIKNHQGQLYLFLYDEVLVVRLHSTDLELEYSTMKRKRDFFGLWRMKSGNFFVLTLPKRVVKENPLFFEELYRKVNIAR